MADETLRVLRLGVGGDHLVLFPFLGGSATSFTRLSGLLSPDWTVWGVDLPGHGRNAAAPLKSCDEAAALLAAAVNSMDGRRLALLGHSFGALLAYRVALELGAIGRLPDLVIVSAAGPPPSLVHQALRLRRLDDGPLLDRLAELGGLPPRLALDVEAARLILPTVRLDLEMMSSAPTRALPPLSCPIAPLAFSQDVIAPLSLMDDWSSYGPNTPATVVAGRHLAPLTSPTATAEAVNSLLRRLLPPVGKA